MDPGLDDPGYNDYRHTAPRNAAQVVKDADARLGQGPRTTRRQRQERRLARSETKLERLNDRVDERREKMEPYAGDYAFMTQPIQGSQHRRVRGQLKSETRDLQEIANTSSKIDGIENALNRNVYADDPDRVERIAGKIANERRELGRVKEANKTFRSFLRDNPEFQRSNNPPDIQTLESFGFTADEARRMERGARLNVRGARSLPTTKMSNRIRTWDQMIKRSEADMAAQDAAVEQIASEEAVATMPEQNAEVDETPKPPKRPMSLGSPKTNEEYRAAWKKLMSSSDEFVILNRKRTHRHFANADLQLQHSVNKDGFAIDGTPTPALQVVTAETVDPASMVRGAIGKTADLALGFPNTPQAIADAKARLDQGNAQVIEIDDVLYDRDRAHQWLDNNLANMQNDPSWFETPEKQAQNKARDARAQAAADAAVAQLDAENLTRKQERQIVDEVAMAERIKARQAEAPQEMAAQGITEGAIAGRKRRRTGVGESNFDTRYYILDAAQIIQSHDPRTGNPNPLYAHSEGLQPRDRKDTVAWVYKTALNLQPLPLIDSSGLGGGPPIIDERGMVLDGNGRVMAFKLAETVPGRMDAYRQAIAEEGPWLGFSDEDIEGAKKLENPIIVSRVLNKADVGAVVRQGNQPRVAALTVQEQSQQDASRFDAGRLNELEIGANDDTFDDILKKSQNQKPIRELLEDMTSGNIGGLFDESGRITAAGRQRLTKAAMTYALGSSESANRVLKSWLNQDESEAIGRLKTGVERSLLDLVQLRTKIDSEDLGPEFDIADNIAKVIESYPAARKYKDRLAAHPYDIDSYFTASGFGPTSVSALNDEQRALLRKFHAINRSPIAVSSLLGSYVRHASGNAIPKNQSAMMDLSQFSDAQDPKTALIKAEAELQSTGRTSEMFIADALEHGRLTGLSSGDTTNTEKALGQLAGVQASAPAYAGQAIEPDAAKPAPPTPAPAPIPPVSKPVAPESVAQVVSPVIPDAQPVTERPETYFIDKMRAAARKTEELGIPVPSESYIGRLATAAVAFDRRKEFDAHLAANEWLSVSTAPDLSEAVQRPRYAEEHDEMPDLEEYRGWARRRANLAKTRGLSMADPDALDRLAELAERVRRENKRTYSDSRTAWMQDVPMTPESVAELETAIKATGTQWEIERKALQKQAAAPAPVDSSPTEALKPAQKPVAKDATQKAEQNTPPKTQSTPPADSVGDLRTAIMNVNRSIWTVRDDLKGDADQTRMITRTGDEPDYESADREHSAMQELELANTPSMFNDPESQLQDLYVKKVREYAALEAEMEVKGRHRSAATQEAHQRLEKEYQRMNKAPLPRMQPATRSGGGRRRGGGGDAMMAGFLPKGVSMEQAGYGKKKELYT